MVLYLDMQRFGFDCLQLVQNSLIEAGLLIHLIILNLYKSLSLAM